jgi:hypothetical protein
MKKLSAFLLTLIYLAFTVGVASDTPWSEADAFSAIATYSVSGDNGNDDNNFVAAEDGMQGIKVNAHHTPAPGKIKMPRAGVVTNRFVSYSPITLGNYTAKHFTRSTDAGPPANLYIRYCVLLI